MKRHLNHTMQQQRRSLLMRAFQLLVFLLYFWEHSCHALPNEQNEETLEFLNVQSRIELRNQVQEMFYHAYDSYMEHAWPWDELKPLSCTPRRWDEKVRGTLDDTLGGYSLTLVDTLDTLAVIGDWQEFFAAISRVCAHVSFDRDVEVSVFESTIRVLGGLLSAHLIAIGPFAELNSSPENKHPYDNHTLLDLAVDLGERLLPAFDTPSGIPYHRVNLVRGVLPDESTITCTAAATLVLEFGVLSRVSGRAEFEMLARRAVKELWSRRSGHDLMGNTIDVVTGGWTGRNSGIGAGIDSFFEYLLKTYVAFGDHESLVMFEAAYNAAIEHYAFGPWFIDVDMHSGKSSARNFLVSSLQAFWPGLQVLAGEVGAAQQSYSAFYSLFQAYKAIPEGFNLQTQQLWVHGKGYPLRPEFAESTMLLYEATKDPAYLAVGKQIVEALLEGSRVECGFAAISDVSMMMQEDRMDSFFLSETLKYLYMLFDLGVTELTDSSSSESLLNDNNKQQTSWQSWSNPESTMFSTEGHLFLLDETLRSSSDREELKEPSSSWWSARVCKLPGGSMKKMKEPESVESTTKASPDDQPSRTPNEQPAVDKSGVGDVTRNRVVTNQCRTDLSSNTEVPSEPNKSFIESIEGTVTSAEHHLPPGGVTVGSIGVTTIVGPVVDPNQGNLPKAEQQRLSSIVSQAQTEIKSTLDHGGLFQASVAKFGVPWSSETPQTMLVVQAEPIYACSSIINANTIRSFASQVLHASSGDGSPLKLAVLVARGKCTFVSKVERIVHETGASIVLVANANDDHRIVMGTSGLPTQHLPVQVAMLPRRVATVLLSNPELMMGPRMSTRGGIGTTVAFVVRIPELNAARIAAQQQRHENKEVPGTGFEFIRKLKLATMRMLEQIVYG